MAIVFDTAQVASSQRRAALASKIIDGGVISRISFDDTDAVHGNISTWQFGTASIFRLESSGISMARTAKAVRAKSFDFLAIIQNGGGTAQYRTASTSRRIPFGDIVVCDLTRPFQYTRSGHGGNQTLEIPLNELGVSVNLIRRAADRLPSSPLYGLLGRHIHDMATNAEDLSTDAAAGQLGTASIELVRALLLSAAGPTAAERDMLDQTLITQVRAHVRQHLRDPDLGADTVAAAVAISTRQLYRVCAAADLHLEQWIITKRLEGARAELADGRASAGTIAAVAHRWGFKDATHFTRRFRAAYGILPSQWQRAAREAAGP